MITLLPEQPWHAWNWIAAWYLLTSLMCFVSYAVDKSAAIAGRRRISERTLIVWGLLGGWPGAILGQRFLRHKSKKTRFLIVFWISVFLNVVVFLGFVFRAAIQ